MNGTYDVTLQDNIVGKILVTKEGLYYRFRCKCELAEDVCRLYVHCDDTLVKIGVLVPVEDGFGLDTKLPMKQFGQGEGKFFIEPNRTVYTGRFVPISPEEPFSYIEKLKDAYLVRQNGQCGIMIQEKAGT